MLAEDDVLDRVERIDGWLTRAEARVLYWLARNAAGPIVEIGSYRGRSTAALALGSKAGGERDVYAVDPFIGPQSGTRPTHSGKLSGECSCSPELLRANLDLAGVNGLVRIVPRKSENALADVPASIDLLFVDGAHDYESVCRDLDNYLPRVERGGFVVLHDVAETDMGVVRAARSRLLSHPNEWRVIDRVGSALVLRRVDTPRRVVNLMCPGRGFDWGPLTGIVQSSLGAHQVELDNNAAGRLAGHPGRRDGRARPRHDLRRLSPEGRQGRALLRRRRRGQPLGRLAPANREGVDDAAADLRPRRPQDARLLR